MIQDAKYRLYQDFLEQFPLESLEYMTLEKYTNLNRDDSFCYWLESKTETLGSIWGGSAYKFNIFRYIKEPKYNGKYLHDNKYSWYARLGKSADEAFAGTKELIVRIAHLASEGNLEAIDRIRGIGHAFKWKIAFMYSDLRIVHIYNLDDLRNAALEMGMEHADKASASAIQRFLAERQDGRDIFEYSDYLWALLQSSEHRLKHKLIRPIEKRTKKYPSWREMYLPELRYMSDGKTAEYKALFRYIGEYYGWTQEDFDIPKLDGTSLLENRVRWSVHKLKHEKLIQLAPGHKDGKFIIRPEGLAWLEANDPEFRKNGKYTDSDFLNDVFMDSESLFKLKELVKNKKNVILQGAPGVGKTYSARRLAYAIMSEKDDSRIEMVQFHQNYSYEDFIMGYKPTDNGGFGLKEGSFFKFCKRASADKDKKDYFFIIDEINRGNLSRIFGELLMLIERGYRGTGLKLAYTDEVFTVPENLYIIGMMNTADRSLAMIDYALRRRFSFYNIHPGFETPGFRSEISKYSDIRVPKIIEAICQLNDTIARDNSLGEGFKIGHSYFCGQPDDSLWIENTIRFDILPMLEEYWFDNRDKFRQESSRLLNLLK